jgi:site-specific DNA-cytosine methylase
VKLLDLFCGKKGWSRPFEERGHEVITVDIDSKFRPTLVADVAAIDATWFLERFGRPDLALLSPPCESFSVMALSHNWEMKGGKPVPRQRGRDVLTLDLEQRRILEGAILGLDLVRKAVALVKALGVRYWILENPRAMLRTSGILDEYPRHTVTYCQYGETNQKPTDLWGVFPPSLSLSNLHARKATLATFRPLAAQRPRGASKEKVPQRRGP